MISLVCHPDTPSTAVRSVGVQIFPSTATALMLSYHVEPANTLLLPEGGFGRCDGLWRTTCFELFVKSETAASYREFNFAPPGAWAAYDFTDWRAGMTSPDLEAPHLVDCRIDDRHEIYPERYEIDVVIDRRALPDSPAIMSLTAVIEETDGTKSYWALRHPPGKPDFHHPDCFALRIPALA